MTTHFFRKKKKDNYSIISNTPLKDQRLSWKAKGILAYLLHLPDDWKIQQAHLVNQSKDGKDGLLSGLKELTELGYLVCKMIQNEKGQFIGKEWIIYEDGDAPPQENSKNNNHNPEKPLPVFPAPVYPALEKPPLLSTNRLNTDLTKDLSKQDIAQTAAPPRKKEISFDEEKREFTGIEDKDRVSWQELYPVVNIEFELKKMVEWCLANPTKAKSKRLWRKFITNWLSKTNEQLINKQAFTQGKNETSKRYATPNSSENATPEFKPRFHHKIGG